jgi:hypothetical protein
MSSIYRTYVSIQLSDSTRCCCQIHCRYHNHNATRWRLVGAAKERWQMTVLRDGEGPLEPLQAYPLELRFTA